LTSKAPADKELALRQIAKTSINRYQAIIGSMISTP